MASKSTTAALTGLIADARDRAADVVATDGRRRRRPRWLGRMLWLGIGAGIGAAATSRQLLREISSELGDGEGSGASADETR